MRKLLTASLLTILSAGSAMAASGQYDGNWMIRARALGVVPDENSTLNIGGEVDVDNSVVPEVDFSYFFTPNIAAELILATTKHNVKTTSGTDVGSAWLLPPTLTLQYHFTNFESFKPYVGAGINYTMFYNEDPGTLSSVDYDNSFGGALQVGVDIPIQNNLYFNVDVKKVFIDTTAKFNGGAVVADVDIDPWLIGVGIGYRF
ncbi:outer membrane beta-barrel protein [bacterium]|nr:outer membrane beta-barrel protein [bacterium]